MLPLLWFFCTAQPIAIHYWYQYRSIALTHWAVGAYVTMTFWQGNAQTELRIEKSSVFIVLLRFPHEKEMVAFTVIV